jgi:hypothetical protein
VAVHQTAELRDPTGPVDAQIVEHQDLLPDLAAVPSGHRIGDGHGVVATPILGGLHHEYRLE